MRNESTTYHFGMCLQMIFNAMTSDICFVLVTIAVVNHADWHIALFAFPLCSVVVGEDDWEALFHHPSQF